jgi:hypothetical protein
VAVLRLTPKAGVDISGNAIKLAQGSQTYAGQICTISGWGVKGKVINLLLKFLFKVMSHTPMKVLEHTHT